MLGTGYVGLVTGTCLSESGNKVTCVDIDLSKIDKLNQGFLPIYETGLQELMDRNVKKKRLFFTTDYAISIPSSEIIFIAVGTPADSEGRTDLSQVDAAADSIATYLTQYAVIVVKSTVPVFTCDRVRSRIQKILDDRKVSITFDVVSNPEFLKEGNSVDDFLKPDRIVIGSDSKLAKQILHKLYQPFVLNGHPIIDMDIYSSELTKYASNAMLATRISFMNEMANLCDKLGADVTSVRKGIGSDPRIGNKFLFPGVGYGGACFPKDVSSLIHMGSDYGIDLKIIKAVESVNFSQKMIIFDRVFEYFNGNLTGKRFTVWGLSFKPRTDDIREGPSLLTIDALLDEGAIVYAYDPVAIENTRLIYDDRITYLETPYEHLDDSDALIIMTEWSEFRMMDISLLKKKMKTPLLFDGRNIFRSSEMRDEGIIYFGIGQGRSS